MTFSREIRVGTRASLLARTQTRWLVDRLREAGHPVAVETITTEGDVQVDRPVAGLGIDGVFVREIERALLDRRIDVAVHSFKDLPTAETPGLEVACVPRRERPFDALVGPPGMTLQTLPSGAVVGTSSVRRVVQVKAARPDLVIRPIRGNVDTRLRRFDAGDYDCLVLAAAGLERLGLGRRITAILEPPTFWPAVAQGALAIQIRSDDHDLHAVVRTLDDEESHAAVLAERGCLAALAGGCLAPIACWARVAGGTIALDARVFEDLGDRVAMITASDATPWPIPAGAGRTSATEVSTSLGQRVARALNDLGAATMLDRGRELPPSKA